MKFQQPARLSTWRVTVALLMAIISSLAIGGTYPADSGVVNVQDHGAKGDGKNDDTKAILAAIGAARTDQGKFFWPSKIVYFPAGTYRVTDTLSKRDEQGRYLASMVLIGESMDSVRLRVDDNTPGFNDTKNPKPVIYTSSTLAGGSPNAGGKDYLGKGEGNDAYGNFVEDMTIDIGGGNPGAVGIDFLASNTGAIRQVKVVAAPGSGRTGISMERKWPGPLLLSNVRVEGFSAGISVGQRDYGVTLENITLSGQSEVALRNNGNMLSMRNIQVETAVVALQNLAADGLIVCDGLTVQLTRRGATWTNNKGYLTVKNVRVLAPSGSDKDKPGESAFSTTDGAYFGNLRLAEFNANWKLETQAAPAATEASMDKWANVGRFGARPDSGLDATEAIRSAMASGAEVVYFPSGRYAVSENIVVPPTVRRIVGMFSAITVLRTRSPGVQRDSGIFRVINAGAPLTIEKITLDNMGLGSQLGIEHSGRRTLVLRDVVAAGLGLVRRTANGGSLFLENTCCGSMAVAGSNGIWARQFNTEGQGVRITNEGAPLSILGLKTEQNSTAVLNLTGADTEILGGLLYIVRPPKDDVRPAFINAPGARLSAAYVETSYIDGAAYAVHVAEGRESRAINDAVGPAAITANQLPSRGRGRISPGYEVPTRTAPK